ncbi:MAG: prepilin peptidase [Candidatus Omnitrophica bacterium]|nr:prepilin peptidase [Candidatus Omnitrophota bacterium]
MGNSPRRWIARISGVKLDLGAKFLFFIGGNFVGSFLNVCIYRMPRSESIILPRSHCIHCGKVIRWYENIPLLSYIFLKGKCNSCKKPISLRYFIVELLTAVLFVLFYSKFGLSLNLLFFLILICGLIVASFIDFEHQLIPDSISLGGLVLGLVISLFYPAMHHNQLRLQAFLNSLSGAAVGGLSIYAVGVVGKAIFKKEAMGFGDVKFLAMIGTFVGWQKILLVFFLAPFFGAAVGIVLKIRHKIETIPYGPYLSLATVIAILWGNGILNRLLF